METKNLKLIASFTIPNYLREIEVSKSQRPKYYYWDGKDIKAKGKKLLKKYIKKDEETLNRIAYRNGCVYPIDLLGGYFIGYFDKKKKLVAILNYNDVGIEGFHKYSNNIYIINSITEVIPSYCDAILIDNTFTPVIANETQAGKPKKIIIKGQDMYSGVLNQFTRAKIVNELKAFYYNQFKNKSKSWNRLKNHIEYPLYIHLEVHDTIRNKYDRSKKGDGIRWDVGNRAYPYLKTFVDFLVNGYETLPSLIEDDDRLHVMGEGYTFYPINEDDTPELIFKIYKYEQS